MPTLLRLGTSRHVRRLFATLSCCATAILCASAANAQDSTAAAASPGPPGPSSIHGAVIDSIRDGVLVHAIVQYIGIDSTKPKPQTRETLTDALGRYHFDSIAPDLVFKLRVLHPLLDTVGIDLATPPLAVHPGQARVYEIYTPTPGRIVGQICSKSNNFARGEAMLTGFVRDPDTDKPLDSARVSYVFYSVRPGSLGLMMDTLVKRWPVDSETATGRYRFCGLPSTGKGTLQIERRGIKSAEIQVDLKGDLLALRSLGLSRAAVAVEVATDSGKTTQVLKGAAQLKGRVQGPERQAGEGGAHQRRGRAERNEFASGWHVHAG